MVNIFRAGQTLLLPCAEIVFPLGRKSLAHDVIYITHDVIYVTHDVIYLTHDVG